MYVVATDSFMSGWGRAENKINKLIIKCSDIVEARHIETILRTMPEMKYIHIHTTKPYYNKNKYLISLKKVGSYDLKTNRLNLDTLE
jgi:hypothetical protein